MYVSTWSFWRCSHNSNLVGYLHCALEYLQAIDASVVEQLGVVLCSKAALPRIMRILFVNANSRKRSEGKKRAYDADLKLERRLKARLRSGSE
jgi:hypothetical protein